MTICSFGTPAGARLIKTFGSAGACGIEQTDSRGLLELVAVGRFNRTPAAVLNRTTEGVAN